MALQLVVIVCGAKCLWRISQNEEKEPCIAPSCYNWDVISTAFLTRINDGNMLVRVKHTNV
jgi:hypothetical protein